MLRTELRVLYSYIACQFKICSDLYCAVGIAATASIRDKLQLKFLKLVCRMLLYEIIYSSKLEKLRVDIHMLT